MDGAKIPGLLKYRPLDAMLSMYYVIIPWTKTIKTYFLQPSLLHTIATPERPLTICCPSGSRVQITND